MRIGSSGRARMGAALAGSLGELGHEKRWTEKAKPLVAAGPETAAPPAFWPGRTWR
jgi:hypothetical protein